MVNNSTAYARQTFTLFHELAHLLFRVSGITHVALQDVSDLPARDRDLEVSCNNFAAEFLVPDRSIPWETMRQRTLDEVVPELADKYNVSREVILRKLLDRRVVDPQTYGELTARWNREYQERAGSSGGNYYATQATYLGINYLRLAFQRYHSGGISLPELAIHLGMRARNIGKMEDFLMSRL